MLALLKKIKDALYNIFVRAAPPIRDCYEGYVNRHKELHRKLRPLSWLFLLWLNISYHVFRIKPSARGRAAYIKTSESALSQRATPAKFAEQLLCYDIVSFDIFDTLIFRPFAVPSDLFHVVGAKHQYLDFAGIREHAEREVRTEKHKNSATYEVTLQEIYDYIERHVGIEAASGMELELETECDLCYANPYMQQVYKILQKQQKTIIITSDMYLQKEALERLLSHCGYQGYAEIFVSCEYQASKHDGKLYDIVKQKMGADKKIIHIGDNEKADITSAKKHGLTPIHYPNVNHMGTQFRSEEMSAIVGSAYGGVVNSHLHCGLKTYSLQYEFGFVYGGIFVLGYCKFIHDYVAQNHIDKVLFLARDGAILKRAYDKLYPENKSEYVYWSRLAAAKLGAERYKFDYFRRFIWHKANNNVTVKAALVAMELSVLLAKCPISPATIITKEIAKTLEKFISSNWDTVVKTYEPQQIAAKQYYQKVLSDCKTAIAVDVGWAGSGANILNYLVEKKWGIQTKIIGLVAGTNTIHNFERNASESLLQTGALVSYIYSQSHNRHLWYTHDPTHDHNIYFEMLLSSTDPSFKGFYPKSNGYSLEFAPSEPQNKKAIEEIQNGILDFVALYTKRCAGYSFLLNISGNDAYSPFKLALRNDAKYMNSVLKGCTFEPFVGETVTKNQRREEQI